MFRKFFNISLIIALAFSLVLAQSTTPKPTPSVDRLREHAQDLGSAGELEAIDDLLRRGNGAQRQVVVYEANHDLREVMAEIVAATTGDGDTEF